MNSRLNKLIQMQSILSKKANEAREAQRKLAKEKRSLARQINQETLMQMALSIQQTGFPIDNLSLITGLAIYGKELLSKQNDPTIKAEIVSYMERYDRFMKETKPKSTEVETDENKVLEDGDDEE